MIHFIHADRVKRVTKKCKVIIEYPIRVNVRLKISGRRVMLISI